MYNFSTEFALEGIKKIKLGKVLQKSHFNFKLYALYIFNLFFNFLKYVDQYYQAKSIFSLLNVISKNLMRHCEKKASRFVSQTCPERVQNR